MNVPEASIAFACARLTFSITSSGVTPGVDTLYSTLVLGLRLS